MSVNSPLLEEIEAFVRDCGIAESTFGLRAVNDGKLVRRLREGGRMYRETEDRIRDFMTASRPSPPEGAGA